MKMHMRLAMSLMSCDELVDTVRSPSYSQGASREVPSELEDAECRWLPFGSEFEKMEWRGDGRISEGLREMLRQVAHLTKPLTKPKTRLRPSPRAGLRLEPTPTPTLEPEPEPEPNPEVKA